MDRQEFTNLARSWKHKVNSISMLRTTVYLYSRAKICNRSSNDANATRPSINTLVQVYSVASESFLTAAALEPTVAAAAELRLVSVAALPTLGTVTFGLGFGLGLEPDL